MMRKLTEKKLVVATHNQGKAKEIEALLAPYGIEILSAAKLGLPEPEETGSTFHENAEIKSLAAAVASNLPALADDSGIVIPALGGAPGIYSARWAGPEKDFSAAMTRVEEELKKSAANDFSAYFVCVLSLSWPDGHTESFEGRIYGTLTFPPKGAGGFGYDPIFIPEGYDETFAELDFALKHSISHRARAFEKLIALLSR